MPDYKTHSFMLPHVYKYILTKSQVPISQPTSFQSIFNRLQYNVISTNHENLSAI